MTQALNTKGRGNVWFNQTRISQTSVTAFHPFHSFPVTVIHFCGSPFSFCLIHFSNLERHCFLPHCSYSYRRRNGLGWTTRYHKLLLLSVVTIFGLVGARLIDRAAGPPRPTAVNSKFRDCHYKLYSSYSQG